MGRRHRLGLINRPIIRDRISRGSAGAASISDSYFSSVTLLAFNENGVDGSTTFIDASSSVHTLTAAGNFQWDDATAPTGLTSSALSDGTGDSIATESSDLGAFGTGDFTIEFWIKTTDTIGDIVRLALTTAGNWGLTLHTAASSIYFQTQTANTNLYSRPYAAIIDGAWHHISCCRSGTDHRMFFDGVQQGATVTDATDYPNTSVLTIASGSNGDLAANLASMRITKGAARYTGNFTPPTRPLPTS